MTGQTDFRLPLIAAYGDRLSVMPGEVMRIMVSTEAPSYRAQVVRLVGGETARDGTGFQEEPIEEIEACTYPGRIQSFRLGSYVSVPSHPALNLAGSFTIQLWIQPTTPDRTRQAVLSRCDADGAGYTLEIDPVYGLVLTVAGLSESALFATHVPLEKGRWYFVAAVIDLELHEVRLVQRPTPEWPIEATAAAVKYSINSNVHAVAASSGRALLLAGTVVTDPLSGSELIGRCFNGRLDRPRIFAVSLHYSQLDALYADTAPIDLGSSLVAAWNFAVNISTDMVHDEGPFGLHGHTRNMPARAMMDHTWRGDVLDWTRDSGSYGSIHFHDDDLDDAQWEVDFEVALPTLLPSGIYAVKLVAKTDPGNPNLEAPLSEEYVPFFVRPVGGTATNNLLFLQSTNTHLAYANWHPQLTEARAKAKGYPWPYPLPPDKAYAIVHGLLSLYDLHSDGSGVCYSSAKRPIMNMRPTLNDELSADGHGYAHGLKADLHVAGWLTARVFDYDVACDEDLHSEGVDLLSRYRVVLTGTHPEYWTREMLVGAEAYLQRGGRFIYLGGNGFYWVTSYDAARPHLIEVRRWGGSQSWTANVGEYHHSTTGELGGLWRERGRTPQRLVGVGFTAMGTPGRAQPYHRTRDSRDPRCAWIFAGIADDELVGTEGLVMDGAAGFEIDRADCALGTPPHALVVATATGFSDVYQHAVEEVEISNSMQAGTVEPRVRADMVFFETPMDGAVFSVGSIAFGGSLAVNGYENAVARVTENTLQGFLQDGPLPGHTVETRHPVTKDSTHK